MENVALIKYQEIIQSQHQNFRIEKSGIQITSGFDYLGASPDGLLNCDCHGKEVLEMPV